ncbi:DUF3467 domain-containing protein [bacterium]|nr:DUF3467 domain-containing protein [bacterium]
MDAHEAQPNLNIEIKEDVADGIYSNLAVINHSAMEFVVDFIQMMPGLPKPRVRSRIILSPMHAKRFAQAMAENVRRYEETHGEIDEPTGPQIPLNFGPAGQA